MEDLLRAYHRDLFLQQLAHVLERLDEHRDDKVDDHDVEYQRVEVLQEGYEDCLIAFEFQHGWIQVGADVPKRLCT